MKKVWFYPFIAGWYDYVFVSLLLGTIVAFIVSLSQVPANIFVGLLLLLLSIVTPVIYYTLLSRHSRYVSPGEMIVGRRVQNGQKVWTNPYKYNRWALFLVIALNLMFLGNIWDTLWDGAVYSLPLVGIRFVLIALVLYGLIELGRGRIQGVMYPLAYWLLRVQQTTNPTLFPGATQDVLQFIAMIFIAMALLNLIIVGIYSFLRYRYNRKITASS